MKLVQQLDAGREDELRKLGRIDVGHRHADQRAQTSAMPFSASVALSAFSEEKHTALPSKTRPLPSSRRSLSLAVTTATRAPAFWKAAKIVGARSHFGIVHHHFAAASRDR